MINFLSKAFAHVENQDKNCHRALLVPRQWYLKPQGLGPGCGGTEWEEFTPPGPVAGSLLHLELVAGRGEFPSWPLAAGKTF